MNKKAFDALQELFPVQWTPKNNNDDVDLRDQFALAVLSGWNEHFHNLTTKEEYIDSIAKVAYEIADSMMRIREYETTKHALVEKECRLFNIQTGEYDILNFGDVLIHSEKNVWLSGDGTRTFLIPDSRFEEGFIKTISINMKK